MLNNDYIQEELLKLMKNFVYLKLKLEIIKKTMRDVQFPLKEAHRFLV